VVLSLGVGAVLVWRVPYGRLRAAFHNLSVGNLFLALLCVLILLFLRVYKWHGLMATTGKGRIRQSLRSLFAGCALGLITPSRLGELGRCVFVRESERAQVAALTVFDRLLDTWALVSLMAAGLFPSRTGAILGVGLWLASIPLLVALPDLVTRLFRLGRRLRIAHFPITEVQAPPVSITRFALLALGAMAAELGAFYFLLRALCPTGFGTVAATFPYIVLAGDVPVTLAGVGVREGAAALLLAPYGVPADAAVDAALLWFVLVMLVPAIIGAAYLVAERLRPSRRKAS
jgi:uncharacterized membrane protein YbhN (UPF0104 family)